MDLVGKVVLLVSIGLGCLASASCRSGQPESPLANGAKPHSTHSGEVRSNILRADYAGSEVCAGCHAKQYAAWVDSPMHRMTRDLERTQINAAFTGNVFQLRGDSLRLERIDGQRFMRLLGKNADERDT